MKILSDKWVVTCRVVTDESTDPVYHRIDQGEWFRAVDTGLVSLPPEQTTAMESLYADYLKTVAE